MMTWLILIALAVLIYGVFIEPRWFVLSRHEVTLDKPLPKPLKVLHLSDTHFHPRNTHINKLFNRLEKLDDIDLVFLTGDIIDNDNGIVLAAEQLKRLKPRIGIVVIFGNHDHYWYGKRELLHLVWKHIFPKFQNNSKLLKSTLEDMGCRVLVNESCLIPFEGTELYIAGLDDPVTKKDEPEKIIPPTDPKQVAILLTHLLDALKKMPDRKFDLVFSGHTHGGQVRIPFFGPIFTHSHLEKKYSAGLHEMEGTRVFTSRGIGTSPIVPTRFFCSPEAVLFTINGKSN